MNEDAPIYPTTVDSSLVPLGRLPLGGDDGSNTGVPYDRRPAGEGGCSAGHLEGCHIYNIKVQHVLPRAFIMRSSHRTHVGVVGTHVLMSTSKTTSAMVDDITRLGRTRGRNGMSILYGCRSFLPFD